MCKTTVKKPFIYWTSDIYMSKELQNLCFYAMSNVFMGRLIIELPPSFHFWSDNISELEMFVAKRAFLKTQSRGGIWVYVCCALWLSNFTILQLLLIRFMFFFSFFSTHEWLGTIYDNVDVPVNDICCTKSDYL